MPFNYRKFTSRFSKTERQKRLEARLEKQLAKEQRKAEYHLATSAEDMRIRKLRKEIADTRALRGKKSKKVKIGGFRFEI